MWVIVSAVLSAFAGPWVHEPGDGYTRLGYRYFESDQGFAVGSATGMQYAAHTAAVYTEWGLPKGFQLIGDLPFVAATQRSPAGVNYHYRWTGDVRFELDYAVLPNARGTVGVEARIPTYRMPADLGQAKGVDDVQFDAVAPRFPLLGDPCVDITIKWMMGYGFGRGWVSGGLGPRFRSTRFRHQAWAYAQAGVWIVPQRLALAAYSEGLVSIPVGSDELTARDWVYSQAQIIWAEPNWLPGWAVEIGAGGVPVGRNTSRGYEVSVGISYRRRANKES